MCYKEKIVSLINPIDWLASQKLYPKVYWKEKGSSTVRAAAGAACSFQYPPCNIKDRVYGGMAFAQDHKNDPSFAQFPRSYFFLPILELSCYEKEAVLLYSQEPAPVEDIPHLIPSLMGIEYLPNFTTWKQMVADCTFLEKVVLARKTICEFKEPLNPFSLLKSMDNPLTTTFLFQPTPAITFLGATPELLFAKEGDKVTVEAVAGTRKRGKDRCEDLALEQALLSSHKDLKEFKIVKEGLEEALSPFATHMEWNTDQIIKTSSVQHLYNKMTSSLKVPLLIDDLLRLLHPTAALGGYPKDKALAAIQCLEPFDRGWYGAPFGVISQERSAFYVAIRSALIKENRAELFTGVGLIQESVAEKEWEELNAKLGFFQPIHEGRL